MQSCCRASVETVEVACSGCPDTAGPMGHAPLPDLDERDAKVLAELARDADSRIAFTGLKRRLGVHQQVLTRTLRRLEEAGWVQRDSGGYRLTEEGYACLRGVPMPSRPQETLSAVQALLPPHARPEEVAGRLAGRWFAGLRWYGRGEAPGEQTLTWLNEKNGAAVRVRLAGHAVNVEVEVPQGDEASAYSALKPLLAALSEVYEAPKPVRSVVAAPPVPTPKTDIRGVAG